VVESQKALSGWLGLEANLASRALELFVALARDPLAAFNRLAFSFSMNRVQHRFCNHGAVSDQYAELS
jgi:hypothetical protein